MDPVTAAGLGLSVTSLTLQLFSGCIKGYQLIVDVIDMPLKFEHIRVRMRLEQVRLLNWGERTGLLEDILQEPSVTLQLHRNLIYDILSEVQRLFGECLKIDTKFSVVISANVNTSAQSKIETSNKSGARRTDALLQKALHGMDVSSQLPTRLKWAMIKQEKFEKLIEQLIRYNDSMVSLLDRVTIREIHDMQVQSQLAMLQLSSKIDDLRQLTQAMQVQVVETKSQSVQLHTVPNVPLIATKSNDHASETRIARLASFKADSMMIESKTSAEETLLLEPSSVHIEETFSERDLASYQQRVVWIEWKEFDQHSQLPYWDKMIESRVKKLAALLSKRDKPAEFRTPTCLGCFRDPDIDMMRYGLVYEIPITGSEEVYPTSLFRLLLQGITPSLTQRIKLATALVNGLMYLHSVNWLHKGMRSDNIVFFTSEKGSVDFSSPTISGFEYARPDLPDEMTEKREQALEQNIYRHPDAFTHVEVRSQKSWDIYSLGIVLIEIALWQTIDTAVGISFESKTAKSRVKRLRNTLLNPEFLQRIGACCGEQYQEVVRRCISGGSDLGIQMGADESDPMVGADMLDVFAKEVVAVLEGLRL